MIARGRECSLGGRVRADKPLARWSLFAHADIRRMPVVPRDLDGPATDIFRNFDSLARSVTFAYYKSMLGAEIRKDQLYPVAALVETQEAAQEGYVTYDRFFLKKLPLSSRLALPSEYPKAPADAKGAKRALIEARNQQQATRKAGLAAIERRSEVDARLLKAEAAWIIRCTDQMECRPWCPRR